MKNNRQIAVFIYFQRQNHLFFVIKIFKKEVRNNSSQRIFSRLFLTYFLWILIISSVFRQEKWLVDSYSVFFFVQNVHKYLFGFIKEWIWFCKWNRSDSCEPRFFVIPQLFIGSSHCRRPYQPAILKNGA